MEDKEIMRNFVSAIFLQAVKDWVKPPKTKIAKNKNIKHFKVSKSEILEFLNSKWCALLCNMIDMPQDTILRKFKNNDICVNLLNEEE